jgi:hypothetical protein
VQIASGLRSGPSLGHHPPRPVRFGLESVEGLLHQLIWDACSRELVADPQVTGATSGERPSSGLGIAPVVCKTRSHERLDRLLALIAAVSLLRKAATELARAPVAVAESSKCRVKRAPGWRCGSTLRHGQLSTVTTSSTSIASSA